MSGSSYTSELSEETPLLNTDRSTQNNGVAQKSDEEDADFSFSKTTKQERILIVFLALMNYLATCCFSLLAPFFPAEAARKGVSTTVTGFIFGVFEFAVFLSSPIFGNYITKIGSKFMYISGMVVAGSCAILFGVLDKSPDGIIYIVICFACRIIEALGCSAFVTAMYAIVGTVFPKGMTTVVGVLETFSGLGMMTGPAIGGALYTAGGFGTPFFVVGSIVIIFGLICAYHFPHIEDHCSKHSKSILYLLKSPLALITGLSISTGSFCLGFMDPNLAQHLSKLNLNVWQIGLMFLIAPGIYAFTAPIWGWLTDQKGYVKTMIITGNIFSAVAMLMLGPTKLISFLPFNLWFTIITLILLGLAIGFSLIPTFKALSNAATQIGMPQNMETQGMVSGLFNSCFSLGAFLGPTVGGVIVDKWGFSWGATGASGLYVLGTLLFLLYVMFSSNCRTDSEIPGDYDTVYVEVDEDRSITKSSSSKEINT